MDYEGKKPTIGIVGAKSEAGFIGAPSHYMEFISKYGNPRILLPHEEFVQDIDMLLLPGGLDINPASYGKVPRYKTTNQDVFKQYFFDHLLKNYVGKIPIIGICLGMQMLNVFFGGTLVQNLNFHEQSPDRWRDAHKVRIIEENHGNRHNNNKPKTIDVNSHHHQAVTMNTLSMELIPLATAEDHGEAGAPIVEAFQHRELPIIGFQWHPEELYDEFSDMIISGLLSKTFYKI